MNSKRTRTRRKETRVTFSLIEQHQEEAKSLFDNVKPYRLVPKFILFINIVEIATFIYYHVNSGDSFNTIHSESSLILRPDKKHELWRFFTFTLLHANWLHLFLNIVIQTIVALPLEYDHGPFQIGAIYFIGAITTSLGVSVFQPNAMLIGASGSLYALLAAHLADILINYRRRIFTWLRVFSVVFIASTDTAYAMITGSEQVSYAAHLSGAIAGFLIGLVVLEADYTNCYLLTMRWSALSIMLIINLTAVFYLILP